MEQHPEILNYQGYLDYQITGDLIEKLSALSQEMNLKRSTYRKIVTIMVEIIENNYKYVSDLNENILEESQKKPFFSLKREENHFIIESGNPILISDAEKLKKWIEHINNLDYNELKELYKNTMAEGIYKNKRGAGLGMMKMVKTSKNNINYSMVKITANLYYYTIRISVPSNHNI